ncbi:uncharacterized protein N7498_004238 [Penicillium cinerascens]|uniref:Uncharacterized protein n=1 Tax=Penicillium cinerascens TaxID=70096 RepID=A0A9W9N3M4_9EURO|nr:uncharacterized protein N7498_004238 [Penicillium cinerascens]KAJ5212592.1 hypothetical protein N7498_004238 [Penicillium cinerascens]
MNYHLVMDDRSVRSILASAEPGQLGMVGYVNVLDAEYEYEPEDPDDNTSEYYHWSVRLNFDHLLRFVLSFQDVGEQAWGSCSIESPDDVLYTDGHGFAVRDKTVFLCPLDDGVHGLFENNIAEFQYLESLE